MGRRSRGRRGVSLGTVVMLTLTALVLVGFCALLPKLTGNVDITLDAAELAVAIDRSIAQIASTAVQTPARHVPDDQPETLPPQSLTTVAPTATPPPKQRFSLCAAGRIDLSNGMLKALTDDTGYRFDLLLDQMGALMHADLTVATLADNVIPTYKLSDINAPGDMLAAFRATGVDALYIGHPNLLDGGVDGLAASARSVAEAGMTAYGAYPDKASRASVTLVDANGVSVALLGYQSDLSNNGKKRASEEEREMALSAPEVDTVAADIARARQAGAQVVLVSLCWGKTNATEPTEQQRELAQSLANAGADILLGTNPEAVQTVELLAADRGDGRYHPALCAYSMGNLVTYNREKRTSLAGLLLHATVEYDPATGLVAFDGMGYTPLYNWRGKEDGATRYRVVQSNVPPAAFMDKDQQGVMERCLKLVREVLADSPLAER